MTRLLLFFGALGIGIAIFFVLLSGVGWQEVWVSLQTFSIIEAAALFVFTGTFLFMGALRWRKILESQKQKISLLDVWKVYVGGFSLLFFIPVIPFANEIFRSSVLKERYNVEFKKGMASVIIDRILEVTSNLCVVVAGGITFLLVGNTFSYSMKTIGIAGFIVLWITLLSLLYLRLFKRKSILQLFWRGNGSIKEVEKEVFTFFSIQNKAFWQGLWLSFLRSLAGLLRVWALVLFLGKGVAILPGVTILGFYYLGILAPIPAGLGSHDTLQAAGFGAFGMGAGTGTAFALLIRAVEAVFALLGLLFLVHFGFRLVGSLILEKGEKFIKVFSHNE